MDKYLDSVERHLQINLLIIPFAHTDESLPE